MVKVDLISEIEKEFKIKIDFFEMVELDNILNDSKTDQVKNQ